MMINCPASITRASHQHCPMTDSKNCRYIIANYWNHQKIIASVKHCEECSASSNLHCCLKCAFIGCGRHEQRHAIGHYQRDNVIPHLTVIFWQTHCVVMNTSEGACWCYECDNVVPVDMSALVKPRRTSPKKIRRLASPLPEGILGGFDNLGNTCYISAAIQVLLNWYPEAY